ncbi:MAG: TIGR00341 family protein [Gemmatimonadota bacterium]|nr:TIGR00341 family protein [Gemmatimonadota bacterium]
MDKNGEDKSTVLVAEHRGRLSADDRRAIFDELASMSTDTGGAYWMVLLLAGAIALLGLALNSAAVVIGAMLIAPLLAPVLGLALALAVGEGRLAIQTAVAVLGSTLAVIAIAALVTVVLPYHEMTPEILSRTKPTTLDLAIAVFSGIAGAIVRVSRTDRLAAALPGVAVSVALVPPLAVTGFGIGSGWNWPVISGSLLLYGANLAGIVMSAMIVLLIAGMHREEVLEEVRRWYRESPRSGVAALVGRAPGIRSMGILKSIPARLTLVLAFVALVAIPLSASLKQITREARIHRAVNVASKVFSTAGHSFIVSRDVTLGQNRTQVILNVATTRWFDDSTRRTFELRASSIANEPVDLVLEQLPASSQDLGHLATMIELHDPTRASAGAQADSAARADPGLQLTALRTSVAKALGVLAWPDSMQMVSFTLSLGGDSAAPQIVVRYASKDTLTAQTQQIMRGELANALHLPAVRFEANAITTGARSLRGVDDAAMDTLLEVMRAAPSAHLVVLAGSLVPGMRVDSLLKRIADGGIEENRTSVERPPGKLLQARVTFP